MLYRLVDINRCSLAVQIDVNKHKCESAIMDAEANMQDAEDNYDDDGYAENADVRKRKQEQLDRHMEAITAFHAEIDELDKKIAQVIKRLEVLYTDEKLEEAGAEQRARIECTAAKAPWRRNNESQGSEWQSVLPAGELEKQVCATVHRTLGAQGKRREKIEDQKAARDKELMDRLMPQLCDGHIAAGA